MWTDFVMFLEETWELVKQHPWVFIVFGMFCLCIGSTLSWKVHSYFIDVKLKNIPEREALLKQVFELQNRIVSLEKELHRHKIVDLIQDSLRDGTNTETIGDVIARNK